MAALDDLLARIDDPALREALTQEIKPLRGEQELGLVFERHLPEKARLYGHPVRRGLTVELRAQQPSPTWTVLKVINGTAHLSRVDNNREIITEDYPVEDLVVVREFGDPIYPGLQSVGRVERGGNKPFHTVINAENYHALETLLFAHEGQIDCIYIDPPYNSGARDWRYNNDYVDQNDRNRHSKWLSFMEKRLKLAKRLLNSEDSLLIVAIDEKEYLRLGLLLEQTFPNARTAMVSSVISQKGVHRDVGVNRVDEYLFFIFVGDASLSPLDPRFTGHERAASKTQIWYPMMRTGTDAARHRSPGCFYPVLVDADTGRIVGCGDALARDARREEYAPPHGLQAIFPIASDGSEARWQMTADGFRQILAAGMAKLGKGDKSGARPVMYIRSGMAERIRSGEIPSNGFDDLGVLQVSSFEGAQAQGARSQWNNVAHDATLYGTNLTKALLPGRRFPYPKSLYAVEDALRWYLTNRPSATVLDFFAGSGTTAHAVMRLNRQDGGQRRSITVTNNEVGVEEQKTLLAEGLLPGDPAWEARGIFEFITKPRIEAAVTGLTSQGKPIEGEYKFTDPFPMAGGFEENVEFFRLTYEDRDRVELGASFEAIAPLLWLRAGAQGPRVDQVDPKGWALPEGGWYGVLFVADVWRQFIEALADRDDVTHAFIVTDSDAVFQQVVAELPAGVEPVRLYGGYLTSFAINTGAQP